MWNFVLSFTPWVIMIILFIVFVRRLNDPDVDIIENLRGRKKGDTDSLNHPHD